MKTENLSTLKINKLTQAQYDRELAAGNIDENAFYLTPEKPTVGEHTSGGGEIFNDYENNQATGTYSHAEGYMTKAIGESSHAEGHEAEALGDRSHVEGGWTKAIGMYSHAGGLSSDANGDCSFVHGEGLNTGGRSATNLGHYQVVFGRYNEGEPGFNDNPGYRPDEMFGFILGNGSDWDNKRNAFMVSWGGTTSSSAASVTGADYAEYFEWLDGNPDNEDRRGYFVTLEGDKIRKANASDEYVLGIISGNPGVLGNSSNVGSWNKKYLTDIFGTVIYEEIEVPETTKVINEEKNIYEVIPAHTEFRPKINPEYDPNKEYKSRSSRPEWSPVGMMGQIVVIDDGTCEVNGYCSVTDNGIVTKSIMGWRVLKRLDDSHILVLFK